MYVEWENCYIVGACVSKDANTTNALVWVNIFPNTDFENVLRNFALGGVVEMFRTDFYKLTWYLLLPFSEKTPTPKIKVF